jgi:AraC-like DNA-binding protein
LLNENGKLILAGRYSLPFKPPALRTQQKSKCKFLVDDPVVAKVQARYLEGIMDGNTIATRGLLVTPELPALNDTNSSIRYLEHGASSAQATWHCHKELELHLVVASSGRFFIGDYIGRYEPGHLVLTGANLPHIWIADSDSQTESTPEPLKIKVINFDGDMFEAASQHMSELREIVNIIRTGGAGHEFQPRDLSIYTDLYERIASSDGLEKMIAFLELMNNLVTEDKITLSTARDWQDFAGPTLRVVNKAIDFILQHYNEKIRLEDVALHVRLSPNRLSKYFFESTGIKYIDFLIKVRISKACEQLKTSHNQITKICYDSGFTNVSNFNRHFLRIKGMTPKQYRDRANLRLS